jgi:predicted O-linked N-acetylglucosamine transferase (SPINDLY family)
MKKNSSNPSLVNQINEKLNRGLLFHNSGQFNSAKILYLEALQLEPNYFETLQLLGALAAQSGEWIEAIDYLTTALKININNSSVYNNLGNVLQELHRYNEALSSYNKAIELEPNFAMAFTNRGNVLKLLGRTNEALSNYDSSLILKHDSATTHYNRGNVLYELGYIDDALVSFDKAIQYQNDYSEAYYNRGNIFFDLKIFNKALINYDRAIEFDNEFAEAFYNRANVIYELRHVDFAHLDSDKLIEYQNIHSYSEFINPLYLQDFNYFDECLKSYDKAIVFKPDYAEAYLNRGSILEELGRFEQAITSYEKAIDLKSDLDFLLGMSINARNHICNWSNFHENNNELIVKIENNENVIPPFTALAIFDLPCIHKIAADLWSKSKFPSQIVTFEKKYSKHNKIKLGYYSADFHNHATSILMAEFFELHDKDKFESFAFSFGPHKQDEMRLRVARAFDHFIDVRNKSDKDIAILSRTLEIDIAIDLKGFTLGSRTGIFAYRCAPVQVNYLGYPGTMSSDYIDYLIADKTLIPVESQKHYSEKIIYLPNTYQVNDSKKKISEILFTREELGLPESGFVFCCFNNNYKITPETFDSWMRILKAIKGSVLWLLEGDIVAAQNLQKEAELRGVQKCRLIFAKRMNLSDHLARHKFADLFLDTLPYNAHTTASDALWTGLPVLTLMGKSFAGRVAASLLHAIELPELITYTQNEYESKAIELATNSEIFEKLKSKLLEKKLTSPLFDTQLFTNHLQKGYQIIYERYQEDLPPDHIYIDS